MALDDQTAQEQLTPEKRRTLLRAFADRMLLKVSAMDDPEDMPGVERAMRTAAVIERIYSRCDRAERQAPDLNRIEAERAHHESEAIRARVKLAHTQAWSELCGKSLESAKVSAFKTDAVQKPVKVRHPAVTAPVATPLTSAMPAKPAAPISATQPSATKAPAAIPGVTTRGLPQTPQVTVTDMTDNIHRARAAMGLPDMSAYDTPPEQDARPASPP